MITLGIETSCDETGVSVVEDNIVLANVVSSSVHLHKRYGGVVPEIASRFHVEYIAEVLADALKSAGMTLGDIDLIAVTSGPGLVGALLTGISTAKALSYSLNKPLIAVNHILAHLYSAFLSDDAPSFPFVGLAVSGGHTALIYFRDIDRYTLLGQTQDDAVGEAYDKVAKILGLGYPGGPAVEKAALRSKGCGTVKFPRSYLGDDSLDFSFSGVKTAVLYYVRDRYGRLQGTGYRLQIKDKEFISDVCYAFQEAVLDVLVEKAFLAARIKKCNRIVLGGGVTINSRLREKFLEASRLSGGVKVHFPAKAYCLDNAAMVAALGERLYGKGHRCGLDIGPEPNMKLREAMNV